MRNCVIRVWSKIIINEPVREFDQSRRGSLCYSFIIIMLLRLLYNDRCSPWSATWEIVYCFPSCFVALDSTAQHSTALVPSHPNYLVIVFRAQGNRETTRSWAAFGCFFQTWPAGDGEWGGVRRSAPLGIGFQRVANHWAGPTWNPFPFTRRLCCRERILYNIKRSPLSASSFAR